ncbi:MAG: hypothetical protein K2J80_04745 [Oscillospiraceae bacterium]|nr:hypothetical protein [Oscillospiraceae bacterium]
MEIPQEVIESGVCTVYPNTDPELLIRVEKYNERMGIARRFRRKLWLLERVFLALNITMPLVFGMMPTGVIYILDPRIEWLEWTALGVFAAAYLFFGLWRRNLIAVTVASSLLMLTDMRCALMLGVDIVLTVFREKGVRTLKRAEGYPRFAAIMIEKKSGNEPKERGNDIDGLQDNGK